MDIRDLLPQRVLHASGQDMPSFAPGEERQHKHRRPPPGEFPPFTWRVNAFQPSSEQIPAKAAHSTNTRISVKPEPRIVTVPVQLPDSNDPQTLVNSVVDGAAEIDGTKLKFTLVRDRSPSLFL